MTATDRAYTPIEQVLERRDCQAPRCTQEFRPGGPYDPYCSARCARLAGVEARNTALRPLPVDQPPPAPARCALPGCEKPVQPVKGLGHCSRDHALLHAQARAKAAEGAGPTELAQVLGLPAPASEGVDEDLPAETTEPAGDVDEASAHDDGQAPGRVCAYGPCQQPPMREDGTGWPRKFCSFDHFKAARAGNDGAAAEVHTPDPTDEHVGAAGALAGPLLNTPPAEGLEASPATVEPAPPSDPTGPPGGRADRPPAGDAVDRYWESLDEGSDELPVTARSVALSGGGWVKVTIAADLFDLDNLDRQFVLGLVDDVMRHRRFRGAGP